MHTIETIRTFRTNQFVVRVRAVEDNDLDLSWDDTGEITEKLNSGELMGFGIVATVEFDGMEISEDSLFGCIYASPKDFMDHRLCAEQTRKLRAEGNTGICGSYFSDIVSNVCRAARKTLSEMQTIKLRA